MKNFLFSSALITTFAFLVACGGDSGSASHDIQDTSSNSSAGKMPDMKTVETENDLPDCTAKREGKTFYVENLEEILVCVDGVWEVDSSGNRDSDDEDGGDEGGETSSSSRKALSSSSNAVNSSSSEKTNSSSSEDVSSSSEVKNLCTEKVIRFESSTPAVVKASGYYDCDTYNCIRTDFLNQDMLDKGEYGEILDTRDNTVYKVVTIGEGDSAQTWMAQNLDYDPGDVSCMGSSAWSGCFSNGYDLCFRLYTWEVVMNDSACVYGKICNPSDTIQGLCPNGWHVPSVDDWHTLFVNVGGIDNAGVALRSPKMWKFYSKLKEGKDTYGFAVLPSATRYESFNGVDFSDYKSDYVEFWTSTESNDVRAGNVFFNHNDENAGLWSNTDKKKYAMLVRCLLNSNKR